MEFLNIIIGILGILIGYILGSVNPGYILGKLGLNFRYTIRGIRPKAE